MLLGVYHSLNLENSMRKAHLHSLKEDNSLWQPGTPQNFIVSGDKLSVERDEGTVLCVIRSLLLKAGYTSSTNCYR